MDSLKIRKLLDDPGDEVEETDFMASLRVLTNDAAKTIKRFFVG